MVKTDKSKIKNNNDKYTVRNALVNYFLLLMFTIFPLFATNHFFNIRHDKYYFYVFLSAIILIAELVLIISVKMETNKAGIKPINNSSQNVWYKSFSVTDWAMLSLFIICFISTLLSSFPLDSLLGTAGRNNGLILIGIYVAIYFLITRYFYFMDYTFVAFAVASAIVYLLSIVNCFYIDPLNMFVGLDEKVIADFTSTIGNKNLLSSYICVSLPVFITMFVHTKNKVFSYIYLAVCALGFAGLMTADSDSGILGLVGFTAIFLIWYSKHINKLKKYFLSITVMLIGAKLLRLFSLIMNDKSKEMATYQKFFVYDNASYIIIALLVIITLALYFIDNKKPNITLGNAVPIILTVILILCIVGIVYIVFYFSFVNTTTNLGKLEKVIRFNDKWGTHRGFMWIRSLWIFNDGSILDKLFGTGPDTFYYAFQPYFNDLSKFGDSSTNAAHNEYLNYLITIGITGTIAYITVIISSIVRAVKSSAKNPLVIVFVSAVICYSIQAIVNIAQPITTPLFFIFLALTEATVRSKQKSSDK